MRKVLIGLVIVFSVLSCLTPIYAKTKEEIYQEKLAKLEPEDVKGHYELGRWCERNKLSEKAQELFKKTIELKPDHAYARRKLGHFKYKGKWTSPEEMEAQGLVKYEGRWITYDKMMKAKGMVQFEGQWVTRSEKKRLEAQAKKIDALAKQFPYKGVLDKPGADSENLPWEKARTKETEHLIVKTNLSKAALNDICFILECAYLNYQDFFGCEQAKGQKLLVLILKNREDYKKVFHDLHGADPGPGDMGYYTPASNPFNKSGQSHLLSFYDLANRQPLISMLLHECTHYAIDLLTAKYGCSESPMWLNEGWATYYDASRLDGKRLATNVISQKRLVRIKEALSQRTYIELKTFINRSKVNYDFDICYPEGWSLMYFLINGQNGKYKTGIQAYMVAWQKGKAATDGWKVGDCYLTDKPAHLKLFEECMGASIDQLEEEWKE
ncbi:DUF1570 domain-containing protein [Planctomycetota bacterium]